MSTPPTVAPWVRTRLRSAPSAAWLTAALVLVAVFLAAALPRALDRSADGALRAHLRAGGPGGAAVTAASMRLAMDPAGPPWADRLDLLADELAKSVHAPLRPGAGGPVYGSTTLAPRSLANPGLPRPMGKAPVLDLVYLHGAEANARLVAGRWPTALRDGAEVKDFEVALSEPVAQKFGVSVGSVLDAGSEPTLRPPPTLRATVVGVFAAADPQAPFWAGTDCLVAPCLSSVGVNPSERTDYWRATALIGPAEIGTSALAAWSARAPQDFVRLPIDVSAARADQLPQLRAALGTLTGGPQLTRLQALTARTDLTVRSPMLALLDEAQHRQAAVAPLTVLGPAGAAGVALTVLLLAAALASERRAAELRLLRARGASRPALLGRLLGESAVTALPAAAVATALALLVLPTPRWGGALLGAAAATAVALLVFPLRAALLSGVGFGSGRRRVVAELSVLALSAAAVVAVRQRGVAPAGAGVDLLLVAAPLLIALAGAVLLARMLPALVRVAARWAARRPGAVGFLSLTRAAGGGGRRPTLLPLLALLLAVTTAGFGTMVLGSVDRGRLGAVRVAVGADARVESATLLPAGFAGAAERLPGARGGVSAFTDRTASVATADAGLLPNVSLLVVDPAQYAALARYDGSGGFDPALLAGGGPDWVPALVTPALAERLDDRSHDAHGATWTASFRMAGVIRNGPALGSGEAIVLPARQTVALAPKLAGVNLWLGTGSLHAADLRALLHRLDPATPEGSSTYVVRSGSDQAATLAADPLQHSAARVFLASVLAAAGFAVLAVLLTLARSGPERAALLARLRTMGLRPRQGLAVILVESLPTALGAAVAGGLLAVGAVLLLGPSVDLSALVGLAAPDGIVPSARAVLAQSLVLLAVFSATVVAEALVSGRRQIAAELRAGDDR
ncbi:hypothetical protein [Streptomyces sp. TLI_171]|uniref:hypothetical protein n=1 Tax=Streptomyces sp. TLI_171 TaxID=1938859 RepID=UPI000C6930B2|nr:hypothetical protein [Streptomyces sp. TLI_171]RKE16901.1 putative ABC transport system permease protein [Streptomyces sp. TLI_171]